MSDHIPFEIQIQIMKKLPITSLIQFRSVSKQWKTLIDSSNFIADYTVSNHAQPQHRLLIRYENLSCEESYISFVDDPSFPQNTFSPTVPTSIRLLEESEVIGTSHGLVCLLGYYRNPDDSGLYSGTKMAVVWNPFIRKSVAIAVPKADRFEEISLGFGVCPRTCDPKIVKIDFISNSHWQVKVYTLSSGVWRSSIGNVPRKVVDFNCHCSQVVIDGTIYWLGTSPSVDTRVNLLISFDLSCEEFREIHLPLTLALHHDPMNLYLCNRSDSVAVIKGCIWGQNFQVWMMEKNADSKSFVKLFSISLTGVSAGPLDFRRNGDLVMKIQDFTDESESAVLVVYEPSLKQISDLGIKGLYDTVAAYPFSMCPYTESLLLLDKQYALVDGDDEEMN